MFAPEGYTSISRLYRNFVQGGVDDIAGLDVVAVGDTFAVQKDVIWYLVDNLEDIFWGRVGENVYACPPSGPPVKLDLTAIKTLQDQWEFTRETFETCEKVNAVAFNEKIEGIPKALVGPNFISEHKSPEVLSPLSEDGAAVPFRTLWEYGMELGVVKLHKTIPKFYERMGFTITLQASECFMHRFDWNEYTGIETFCRTLKPMEGWSLCVPESFAKEVSFFESVIAREEASRRKKGGRPPTKRQQAGKVYNELFPEGHSGTWYDALREINKKFDEPVSRDTLIRAAKAFRKSSM